MDLLTEGTTGIAVSGEIANTDRVLNIAYDISRNFLSGATISIQSVVIHNPDLVVKFRLFTDYIDEDYLRHVNAFISKNANVEVRIYKVSSAFIDIFPSLKQRSYTTFLRLVAFQYLSETIENLLYIDADIIYKDSLAGSPDINFDSDKFVAIIKDVPFMQGKPARCLAIEGLPGNYLSAGVVYPQLEAWAKNDFVNRAIVMLANDPQHMKCKCLDQDILNILFFSHYIFIGGDYDCFYGVDYELKNKSSEDHGKTITDDTRLIHCIGIMKPQDDWTNYPCQKYFNEACQVSCWNDVAFIPAASGEQYQVKYQHAKKNGDTFSAFIYFIKFKLNKYKRKLFRQ